MHISNGYYYRARTADFINKGYDTNDQAESSTAPSTSKNKTKVSDLRLKLNDKHIMDQRLA